MGPHNPAYERPDWLSFAITVTFSLTVYLLTLTPNVSLGFSGIFSTAALHGGVPHPPGYPLAVLWQSLFVHLLPVSNIAWRVAVSSAVAGATASGLIALLVSRLGKELLHDTTTHTRSARTICGFVAGSVFSFNGAFWGPAVVADVWTLSIALFCTAICLLIRWCFTPHRSRYLHISAFVYGLTLTNSQILLAAAPCIPVLLRFRHTRQILTRPKTLVVCGAAFIFGLTPYLYVPIASMTNPPMNWGYPRTVGGLYHVISRGQYERITLPADFRTFSRQVRMYVEISGKEFGWPFLIMAFLPWFFFRQMAANLRTFLLASFVLYLCLTLLLIAVINPIDHLDGRRTLKVFCSPSYIILALWFGLGLFKLTEVVCKSKRTSSRVPLPPLL